MLPQKAIKHCFVSVIIKSGPLSQRHHTVFLLFFLFFFFLQSMCTSLFVLFNPVALRKTKIECNFGLSECNRVKVQNGIALPKILVSALYSIQLGEHLVIGQLNFS